LLGTSSGKGPLGKENITWEKNITKNLTEIGYENVNWTVLFFWVVTPCGLVGRYYSFGEHTVSIFRTSALKMETVCFSETSVSAYKSTRRYYPEDQHPRRRENLKSHITVPDWLGTRDSGGLLY
jgi:hypothetical protein